MESQEIAVFVRDFNILSVTALAFFAVFGVIRIVAGKSFLNIFRKRIFLGAFCVAALAAFALEATVFNFQHYLKYFAGPELQTLDVSPENPNFIRTSDGDSAEIVTEQGSRGLPSSGIRFKNVDRKVTSVFADLDFGDFAMGEVAVSWTDEEGSRGFVKRLFAGLPHENYIVIQPHGKVSELKVLFSALGRGESGLAVSQVVLNRQIPFYFSGLRLLAVSLLLFGAAVFFRKTLRAKAARFLLEYKFNPASLKQNLVYALAVVLLILFSWVCVYTTMYPKSLQTQLGHPQYNKHLVDAIIDGRVYLDYGTPEKLLDAERPYDQTWRIANGYRVSTDWMWDWVWYKGKYYCYYGAVPAIILYVPYKLITGNYLSNHAGVFIFTSISIVLLSALWRYCVKRYMPDCAFAFFLLSFLALFFASGFYTVSNFPRFYSIVQAAGFMFAIAGILLLLKSVENEKINRLKLFFACLCLALVVGCRPNMIFVSLLVPVVLWKHKSWKLFAFVMIPYVLVAIPICWYNYARFDSIFDFGQKHTLTGMNLHALDSLNPIGLITRTSFAVIAYVFCPNAYSLRFPYVECFQGDFSEFTLGFITLFGNCPGMINFPIAFCLFYLFRNMVGKNRPKHFDVLCTFLAIAAVIMAVNAQMNGALSRFILDFATFIILPSLFCAYYWSVCPRSEWPGKLRLNVVYILLVASIFVGLFLSVTGGMNHRELRDPVLYRYLEYSLGIIRNY